jgi:hypothetical protein
MVLPWLGRRRSFYAGLVAERGSHSGFRAIQKIGTIQASSEIIRGIPGNMRRLNGGSRGFSKWL